MSQTYEPTFNPDDIVQDTMNEVFDNFAALRSKFSGSNSPGSPELYQWWVNTTTNSNILKINTVGGWVDIYDFDANELILSTGSVHADTIADDARKPTIIAGEDIAPNTCTIRAAGGLPVALPWSATGFSLVWAYTGTGGWAKVSPYWRVNAQPGGDLAMTVQSNQPAGSIAFRFKFAGSTSTEVAGTVGTVAWLPSDCLLDTSSITGWQDLYIEMQSSTNVNDHVYGFSFYWKNA